MHGRADRGEGTLSRAVRAHGPTGVVERPDTLAVEEPMEIRVQSGDAPKRARSVSVTMRTPGHDFELAVGFLFGEGLIKAGDDVERIAFCGPPPPGKDQSNIVRVELRPGIAIDLVKLERNFYATSSCGICGKASLDALDLEGYPHLEGASPRLPAAQIQALPEALRAAQPIFDTTGGLHAAGLFDASGALVDTREDVGRHNAIDKLIGAQVLQGGVPLSDHILVVSGRVSFEIVQKALAAGIPMLVAVGAPSSLAVEMAERFGMTLIGFARDGRFNVYSGDARVKADEC